LDDYDHSISLYSFRHQYICWRLRYGQVPIHLIAKNCGTSIQKIDETYGHIEVEKQVDILTHNQGIMRSADIDLTTEILD
jgi:integrase